MNRRRTGAQYETYAVKYLEKQHYQILERNYQIRTGEIDIIAKDGEYLVFAEVKYRKDASCGTPFEAVDIRKQKKIIRTACYYLHQKGYGDVPCRFDVIGITGTELCHIKHAFEGTGR